MFATHLAPSADAQLNQAPGHQPVTHPSTATPVLVNYGYPAVSSHDQHHYSTPDLGPMLFNPEDFGLAAHPAQSLADLAPNVVHPNYPTNIQASNQSGVIAPMSMSSSTNLSSRPQSLFDSISASNHSHLNSSSNIEVPPSEPWGLPSTTSNAVLSTWLQKNPLTIALSQLDDALKEDRYHKEWLNWEKQFVIFFWVGPQVPAHLVFIAMGAQKSPGPSEQFSPEWDMV